MADINGVGVGLAAGGLVLIYAGFRNIPLMVAFKDLAMGKAPAPRPKPAFEGIMLNLPGATGFMEDQGLTGAGAGVVHMAHAVAATPAGKANYCWGGGHGSNPCAARCFDCSGYVSCVLNRLGLLKGSMVTTQFLSWSGAVTVPYEQRQPGDLLVNTGHMGIAVNDRQMLNAACTACGAVKLSDYTSRRYTVRRVKAASSSATPSRQRPGATAI